MALSSIYVDIVLKTTAEQKRNKEKLHKNQEPLLTKVQRLLLFRKIVQSTPCDHFHHNKIPVFALCQMLKNERVFANHENHFAMVGIKCLPLWIYTKKDIC